MATSPKPKDLLIKGSIDYEGKRYVTHRCGNCFILEGKRGFELEYDSSYVGGDPEKVLKWVEKAVIWVKDKKEENNGGKQQ